MGYEGFQQTAHRQRHHYEDRHIFKADLTIYFIKENKNPP